MDKKSRELVMAKLYFKNKDYKMAEKSFNEYLAMNPDDVAALKLLAQVYEQNKRFDRAFEMYERCYLAEPERTGVLLDICRILLMNEVWLDNVDYRKWLNLAIKAFPSNPIVVNFKAFLSTLPAEDLSSPPRETQSKNVTSTLNEDTLAKILEKLTTVEEKIQSLEQKVVQLSYIPQTTGLAQPNPSPQSIPFKQQIEPKQPVLPTPSVQPTTSIQLTPLIKPTPSNQSTPPIQSKQTIGSSPLIQPQQLFLPKQPVEPNKPIEVTKPIQSPKPIQQAQPAEPKQQANPFSFNFTSPPGGNFFAESLSRLNMPSEGSWTSQTNAGFSFSQPGPNEEKENDNKDEDDKVENEELPIENTCDMKPIEIKTGEENEDIVFENRCKLFRLRDKEFKERGLGNIKVLKNRETGMGRLIMRRDAIGLVCLNCWNVSKIDRVRDNQVKWGCLDASDGEPEPAVLVVKFKTPELTDTFLKHLHALFPQDGSPNNSVSSPPQAPTANSNPTRPEVELVDPQLDPSLVDRARQLQLPDLFFHKLKNQEPCGGCNGCENDD